MRGSTSQTSLGVMRLIKAPGTVAGGQVLYDGRDVRSYDVLELRRRGLKRGLAAACIGGGQGIAAVVEAL